MPRLGSAYASAVSVTLNFPLARPFAGRRTNVPLRFCNYPTRSFFVVAMILDNCCFDICQKYIF